MRSSAQTSPKLPEDPERQWVWEARKERPPESMEKYFRDWAAFFDQYAPKVKHWRRRNAGYHRAISSLMRFYIPRNQRVLEIGSGTGDLLAEILPQRDRK